MNRNDIIEAISLNVGLPKVLSDKILKALTETITASLSADKEIKIPGFGKFYLVTISPKTRRNPQDGSPVEAKLSKYVRFRQGSALKRVLNENGGR